MAFILGSDYGPRHSGTRLEFPDGNAALRAFFDKTYIQAGSIAKASWVSGIPIPPEVVPTRVRVLSGKGPYDWADVGTSILVSALFKDCVESVDAGRHGFFPVTLEDKAGAIRPKPYYLFNVVGRIDSIIEAQSNLNAVGRGLIDAWGYERRVGPWHCALNQTVIGDRACWTEIRYPRRWFVSDRLAHSLKKERLSGFTFNEYCAERPAT